MKRMAQFMLRLACLGSSGCRQLRIVLICAFAMPSIPGQGQDMLPTLRTNEEDIDAVTRTSALAIEDSIAVFAFVLGQLPPRVQVYPTENYYYFHFVHNGVRYDGNIRLAASNRDQGEVNFAYSETPTDWNEEPHSRHLALGAAQGVTVEKLGPLLYRVTLSAALGGRSVTFALNDLSQVKPPTGYLHADEQFIGPVLDESGMRFFLVFNRRLKVFHYLLDESAKPVDRFDPAKARERILIGKRTGFAFYHYEGRKILIGVSERQSSLNSAYDGPFDQLPENFIQGDVLREAIVASDPRTKGKIDRFGYYTDGAGRYLIHPFLPYWQVNDLAVFDRCATARSVPAAKRALCFVIDNEEATRPNPRPLALKRR